MTLEDTRITAQQLIQLHGLRAQAVAQERASEAQLAGDAAAADRWRQVHDMVCELKRTAREKSSEGASTH